METIKPKSLKEFLELFDNHSNSGNDYYRGQADAKWDIIPSLARNKKIFDSIIEVEGKLNSKFDDKIAEYELIDLIPILKNSHHESWQRLMAAQHYGLPTRLLDFTFNKYVALEFAITDLPFLDKDSAFIIYENADNIQKNETSFFNDPFREIDYSFFLQVSSNKTYENNECKLSEIRKSIQGSKFLYRDADNLFNCLSMDRKHSKNLLKIEISKKLKPIIAEYLMKLKLIIFDSYRGKNAIDYFAAVLKNEFSKLDESKIEDYLKS
jgi:FRG domain